MDKQIIYYYQRGVASYLIAKKLGISNTKVRSILKNAGVDLRSHNVTNKISAKRRTPEENKAITQKATESNTGVKQTKLHRLRLALARQRKPTIDPVYEQPLVNWCKSIDLKVIPQKAFDRFNVDLYIPEYNVVIEIFGGGFHNKPDAVKMFNNKMKYLSKNNIPVLVVWTDRLTYNPASILAVAMTVKEPVTVINGDGSPTSRGLSDIILDD